jgi:hypothetical protein
VQAQEETLSACRHYRTVQSVMLGKTPEAASTQLLETETRSSERGTPIHSNVETENILTMIDEGKRYEKWN